MTTTISSYHLRQFKTAKPGAQWIVALVKRVWWHTKALLPILGIIFLVFGGLGFLQLHRLYRSLLKAPQKRSLSRAELSH